MTQLVSSSVLMLIETAWGASDSLLTTTYLVSRFLNNPYRLLNRFVIALLYEMSFTFREEGATAY